MKTISILSLTAITGLLASTALAQISLESAPPVVVKTVPVAGSANVDPGLTEIRVTYSKPMQDRSWSWCTWREESQLDSTGQPHYLADGRTCVLPVKLQPGKFYATWLNSGEFQNFKDRDGRPAVPYLLTFEMAKPGTAGGGGGGGGAISSVPDPARAVALFNDIEDIGHEFSAAFSATNLPAAQTVTRRLLTLLTNFNDAVRGTDCEFPSSIFEDIARVRHALDAGSWDEARDLAHGNDEYRARFRFIAAKMADLARNQQKTSAAGGGGGAAAGGARGGSPSALPSAPRPGGGKDTLLNEDQRLVLAWTDRQFRSFFDARNFDDRSETDRAELETRMLNTLDGPQTREYYLAINTLAALHSQKAVQPLLAIAAGRAEKDCRDRWMAVRALGMIGDKTVVPELIHLVYHGNTNTRWWAQISLVRLTGQNFASDWQAWGKWWNQQGEKTPFNPEIIRWWNGQPEADKLADTLGQSDGKFLEKLRQ